MPICDSDVKKLSDSGLQDFIVGEAVDSALVDSVSTRLSDCDDSNYVTYSRCSDCGHVRITVGHCFNRFCENCTPERFSRAKGRLSEKMLDFPPIITHLILTIPYGRYTKENKFKLSDSRRKFFQILKRKGVQFSYVGVYDYGNPKNEDMLETNLHVHIALSVPYSFFLNPTWLQECWSRATGIENAVVRVKKAKKSAVLRYLARRAAGDFGHGSERVGFSSYMTLKTYLSVVYKSRYMIAAALSSNVVPNRHNECELCGGNMEFAAQVYRGIITYAIQDFILPT